MSFYSPVALRVTAAQILRAEYALSICAFAAQNCEDSSPRHYCVFATRMFQNSLGNDPATSSDPAGSLQGYSVE